MAEEHEVGRWASAFASRTRLEESNALASILALSGVTDIISFSGGFPDPSTFPGESLVDILRELLAGGDASAMQYAPTPGLPGLRDFMAGRLSRLDGRRPADDELLITSGGIEGLELLGKTFLDPGDLVLVEGPTYLGAIMAFRSFEAEVVAVPMDARGLAVDAVGDLLARGRRPKLLYTIPDHQNPAGVSLSTERRSSLIELADRFGLLIVEDVAYRELGFDGDRPPSLWSMNPQVTVQLGTFSKTFFPGVRLGWTAGPADVIHQLVRAKQSTDQCAGALGQRLLEEYGRRGMLDRGVIAARTLYGRRWEALSVALEQTMPADVTWTAPRGGFFSWVTLPGEADASVIAARARDEGVAFVPGEPFFPDNRGRNNLRLSFSRVSEADIAEGARRLGALFRAATEEGKVSA